VTQKVEVLIFRKLIYRQAFRHLTLYRHIASDIFNIYFNHIIYNKPTRCNSGSIVFIKNYKYAPHVSDALCVRHQEYYKL